jgi:hypothetical protein
MQSQTLGAIQCFGKCPPKSLFYISTCEDQMNERLRISSRFRTADKVKLGRDQEIIKNFTVLNQINPKILIVI